ncbi:MAG: biotin transporter BioY [Fretibacterium sp.]|nr:biotin transporter BioY [Fretibacterium sp.]
MKKKSVNIRDLVLCALFAALVAAGTFIRIPTPLLPLTLQTLSVVLSGLVLGSRRGAVAVAVYVTAGLIGLPVFTQGGGLGYVLNPTFGYIVSFIAGAWLAGFLAGRLKPGLWSWTLAGVAAIVLIYAIGIPYYYVVARWYLGKTLGADVLLWTFVLMPLPGDLVSCLAAALIFRRLRVFLHMDSIPEQA